MAPLSPDGEAALALCRKLLNTLRIMGPDGRAEFVSTLAPDGQACHARWSRDPSVPSPVITFEDNREGFPNRIDWSSRDDYEEGIDDGEGGREIVVLVDHDIAMVWTPYWFKRNGELTHVGTNCFTLAKYPAEGWKIVGMTDTGRLPSDDDRKRLLG
ncbi:hypothetical protein F5884DRAFT_795431 [Xylogone sp. PMI_703]|nr:hypothetical protein F5884DRAFT_795431 [Xylogone sp. PMI_703]